MSMATPELAGLGAGRFEIRGTLGAGGAGTVYRAFDKHSRELGTLFAALVLAKFYFCYTFQCRFLWP